MNQVKNTVSDNKPRRQSDHLSNLRSFQTRASLNIVKNELFPDVVHALSAEKSPKMENFEATNELQMVINEEEEGKNEENDTESKSPSNHGNDSAEKKTMKVKFYNFVMIEKNIIIFKKKVGSFGRR